MTIQNNRAKAKAIGYSVALALGLMTSVCLAWLFSDIGLFKAKRSFDPWITVRGALKVDAMVQSTPVGEKRIIEALTISMPRSGRMPFVVPRDQIMSSDRTWRKHALRDTSFRQWVEWGYGYPFRCLFKWQEEGMAMQGAIELPDPLGLSQHWPGQSTRGLPYLPIWPGLIANTVFWGGVWWCALFVPAMVRRRGRIKRGQCAACGYDLSGNAPNANCPECGGVSIHIKQS